MEQSYLFALIQVLRPEELRSIALFLQSAYFNGGTNQQKIQQLFSIISEDAKSPPVKEDVYRVLFPESPWIAGKLDKLMSELAGLIRKYLLINHHLDEDKSFEQALDWAVLLRKRGLQSRYPQHIQKAERILQDKPMESIHYYFQQFQLAYEKYDVETLNNRARGDLLIPQTVASLDAYYLSCRLELLNLLSLQQKLTPIEIPPHLLLPFRDFLPEEQWSEHVMLNIAAKINDQLKSETHSPEAFQEILSLLQNHDEIIAPAVLQNFYACLRSLCILLMQQNQLHFAPLLHDIQRDNLKRGYLFHGNKLSPSAYLSVARTAIMVGKSDWALSFVDEYRDQILSEEDTENFYSFNKAQCLFALERYEEALEILPQTFADLVYLINCKRLEIKLYYELKSDLLPYKIDAHKMYISRASKKTMSDEMREIEGNFINLLLQVSQCAPGDTPKIDRIIKRIQEKKLVAERDWLIKKTKLLA